MVVLCMVCGWGSAHALEAVAFARAQASNDSMWIATALPRATADRHDRAFGMLGASLAQGVAAAAPGQQAGTSTSAAQDDETVFHLVRGSLGAATDPAFGALGKPSPRLGGLLLLLLAVFATVLGFLSLRWHRETAG